MTTTAKQQSTDVFPGVSSPTPTPVLKERPFLYLFNRRLRHLKGISIRNLSLESSASQPLVRAIDDESLPQTWKSPGKLQALRENNELAQSRSSTNLKRIHSHHASQTARQLDGSNQYSPQHRPELGGRRRSTANWAGASPAVRQRKLESMASDRLLDTFFSLHCINQDGPVYISEVVPLAMNPSFRFFELDECGPSVVREDSFVVKVWARTIAMEQYSLLVELDLHLMSLQYLGKELANFYHPLPQNCILFHLSDGIYTSFTDMPTDSDAVWPRQIKGKAEKVNLTSSFDALMKLANLDDCIQDAAATKERIATQIDSLLTNNRTPQNVIDNSARSNEELGKIGDAVEREQQKLVKAKQKKAESTSSLEARRKALGQGGKGSAGTRALVDDAQVSSKVLQKDLDVVQEDIQGQRRRISEDIIRIYPIEAVQGRPFAFTIRGLYLPNTDFEETDEDHVAGALGYVAEVIFLLACYLYTPLPYPLQLFGSTSTIEDPIAMMTGSRIFPLYPKGSITFRFEYGVFLLDKNLEVLMNQSGLRVLDFRHTLPNLKYLLYVLAAGKGEIPARKAGGVKGLLGMGRSPALSRTNSQDSDVGLWTQRIAGLSLKHKHALNRLREEGSDFISNR